MEITTTLLSIVVLAFLALEIYRTYSRINDMEMRIRNLEDANRLRLPHRSQEELLNAMAVLDKELEERNFYNSLIENAHGHIANALSVGTKREKK